MTRETITMMVCDGCKTERMVPPYPTGSESWSLVEVYEILDGSGKEGSIRKEKGYDFCPQCAKKIP